MIKKEKDYITIIYNIYFLNIQKILDNMKIKHLAIALTITIIFSSISVTAIVKVSENKLNNFTTTNILKKGWLEKYDGVTILYVNGSHYEMGYQHGSLLKYECLENIRAFLYNSEQLGYSFDQLLYIWNKTEANIPQEYIKELQGLADGIGVTFNEVAATYASFDCLALSNCFGIVAWGPATKSNKLIQARSCDLPLTIKDPVTGKYAHENSILLVRNPDDGFASLIPTVAALLNLNGGINEKAIGIGGHLSNSKDQTFNGLPIRIRIQMLIDQASTAEEAINILTTNRTLGYNYVVSDSKNPIGFAVEATSNLSYAGTWNNPVESKYPFWSIDHVVRRTNFFIEPEIAATQRDRYNPGGIIGFLKATFSLIKKLLNQDNHEIFSSDLIFPIWISYKIISKEIEKQWGTLDLDNTLSILRNVNNGKTSILLAIMAKIGKENGFLASWNQWVACPETGDMSVSFANADKCASKNPVHHFNLFELLNS